MYNGPQKNCKWSTRVSKNVDWMSYSKCWHCSHEYRARECWTLPYRQWLPCVAGICALIPRVSLHDRSNPTSEFQSRAEHKRQKQWDPCNTVRHWSLFGFDNFFLFIVSWFVLFRQSKVCVSWMTSHIPRLLDVTLVFKQVFIQESNVYQILAPTKG